MRWRLTPGKLEPDGDPETIVTGLPAGGDHKAKTMAFPGGDVLLVKIGSATNSCQQADRAAKSPGRDPCTELERRAGIWRFSAGRAGQSFGDGRRWATGLRNAEALGVQPGTGALWAAMHGRDQLGQNWGFSDEANAEQSRRGAGAGRRRAMTIGWPYCYYSNDAKRKVLAPEYGGDGKKVGRCATAKAPAIAFPGHWAPMALRSIPATSSGAATRVGCSSRFTDLESRAAAAGGLPRGVRAVRGREARRASTRPSPRSRGPTVSGRWGSRSGRTGRCTSRHDQNGKIWRIVKR